MSRRRGELQFALEYLHFALEYLQFALVFAIRP